MTAVLSIKDTSNHAAPANLPIVDSLVFEGTLLLCPCFAEAEALFCFLGDGCCRGCEEEERLLDPGAAVELFLVPP